MGKSWICRGLITLIMLVTFGLALPTAGMGAELDDIVIEEIEFKDASVRDAVRIISELTGVNIVATAKAGEGRVTFFVRKLAVSKVVDALCRISGLWYRHNPSSGVYVVMTTEEYQRDIVVFRDEPTRMFKLKYLNVGIAARTIADLFGERVELSGKANRQLGNDFAIAGISGFSTDYDLAEMDEEDDDEDEDDNEDGDKKKKARQETEVKLSPSQIALLEEYSKQQSQRVSQEAVGQVAKQTAAPIYLTVNRLHNMLFVRTADQQAMDEIAAIIEASDEQVPEVLLEMKVLEVQLNDQFTSAFDISNISGSSQTGPNDGQSVNPLDATATSVGGSVLGLGNYGVQESSTMVFQLLSSNLRMRLQLLQENQNIKALATPMLLAANNHPARLFIGEEAVITTGFKTQAINYSSGSTTTIVNTVPVAVTKVQQIGNTLTILPSINADRSVVMRIIHKNSSVETDGGKIPVLVGSEVQNVYIDTINSSTLEGTVLAQDGMTVAVGGMMRTVASEIENKVPLLGDIPALGFFFKERQKTEIKTELVLLITPHVLSNPGDGEKLTREKVAELTDQPNHLDGYLDGLAEKRAAKKPVTPGGGEPAAGGAAEAVVSAMEKTYVELIRVAAKQVRQPLLVRRPVGNIRPTQLPAFAELAIFRMPGVKATPVAAWSDGSHSVSALKVRNLTGEPQVLDAGKLLGSWLAATLESQELAAAGSDGDQTYLYLISQRPFVEALPGGRHE